MALCLPGRFDGGRVVRGPVSLVDVLPTVAAAVGAPAPERVHGVDLALPPVDGRVVFASLEDDLEAVRGARWKAVRSLDGAREELYRVDRDPGERADRRESAPEEWERKLAALRRPERRLWAPDTLVVPELDAATEEELRALGYTD
jgi:arylsulfatase A-like enzyme